MIKYFITSIFLLVFNNSILLGQQTEVKEIASSTKAAQSPFVGIDGMTVNNSSLYIVDRVMHRVAILNTKDLQYQSEFSRSEDSQASLFMPGFVAVTSKYIYIADFGGTKIRIFSPTFNFIKKIEINGGLFGIATDKDDNLWVAAATMERQQSLKKIDNNGNILATLPLKFATGGPLEILYTFCIDDNNYFYIAYFTKNCIEVVHPSRGYITHFMVPGLPATVPWSTMKRGMFSKDLKLPDGVMFSSITADNNGRLFILTGDYSETPFREVDICSADGKFLTWCNLKEKSHLIHMDGQGHLISVEGNKNKVKVYEIQNNPNRRGKGR